MLKQGHTLLCITGGDGSGKTTLIHQYLKAQTVQQAATMREVTIWDILRERESAQRFPLEAARIDTYLPELSSFARIHFLLHAWAEALALATSAPASLLFLNAYIYKYLACEVVHGAAIEQVLGNMQQFPSPDRVYYLMLQPEQAALRKQRFSRYECGFSPSASASSFVSFQTRVQQILDGWCTRFGWLRLDATLPSRLLIEQVQADSLLTDANAIWRQ